MKLYNEAKINDGGNAQYSNEPSKTASGLDPYLVSHVNWLKSMYKDWAPYYNANVNVTVEGSDALFSLKQLLRPGWEL